MPENQSTWAALWAWLIASPAIAAAIWGALGGGTNALVIRVTVREAARHVAIGTLIAAGLGGMGGPILEHWGILPTGSVTAMGSATSGAVAYLTGSLGSAVFEVLLSRIRAGRLPTDRGDQP